MNSLLVLTLLVLCGLINGLPISSIKTETETEIENVFFASLSYTEEFTATGTINPVVLTTAVNSFCYFTHVSGNFDGDADEVVLDIVDNYWQLSYSEGPRAAEIEVRARCAVLSTTAISSNDLKINNNNIVNFTSEYVATGAIQSTPMIRTNLGVCAMLQVGGAFNGARDGCRIVESGATQPNWAVEYFASAAPGPGSGYSCRSRCACLDGACGGGLMNSEPSVILSLPSSSSSSSSSKTFANFNITSEYQVTGRTEDVDMGAASSFYCFLTGFGGDFGSEMYCTISIENSRWILTYDNGAGRGSITCKARCISTSIIG